MQGAVVILSLVGWWSWSTFTAVFAAPTSTSSDRGITTPNPNAPLEFPQFSQDYIFVENSSLRENFVSRSNESEVQDLLSRKEEPEVVDEKVEPSQFEEEITRKNATEWIENGDDTEDGKFRTETTNPIMESTAKTITAYKDGVAVIDGNAAAILAVTFLVISVLAYVALLLWRHSLERKYGSREMLMDKDETNDPDGLKNFSI